jgi:hypothetical protein
MRLGWDGRAGQGSGCVLSRPALSLSLLFPFSGYGPHVGSVC